MRKLSDKGREFWGNAISAAIMIPIVSGMLSATVVGIVAVPILQLAAVFSHGGWWYSEVVEVVAIISFIPGFLFGIGHARKCIHERPWERA